MLFLRKFKKETIVYIVIFLFISFLNVLSIMSQNFSTFYRDKIFVYMSIFISFISNVFPFSLGEILIYLSITIVCVYIVSLFSFILKNKYLIIVRKIVGKIIVWCLLYVYISETLNCFILYHTETLAETMELEVENNSSELYNEELIKIYENVVEELNQLSTTFDRTNEGDLIIDLDNEDMYKQCISSLKNVSNYFGNLSGYYPNPKKILASEFMTQQYLAGIYFPFTIEANYNKLMYVSNYPATICHELSHLKGYIREDEANYIAYVACIMSENDYFRYSGYLSVYYYIEKDVVKNADEGIYEKLPEINDLVRNDLTFVSEEKMKEIEESSLISTDAITEATDKFIDTNLVINGISSGINNYSEVVKLIILSSIY